MNLFEVVFLGVLQGVTEFLPVSSSGHLAVFQFFFEPSSDYIVFDIMLHVSTLAAILIFFRGDIMKLALGVGRIKHYKTEENPRLVALIAIATLVTGIIGITGKSAVYGSFKYPQLVAVFFMLTGIILAFGERFSSGLKEAPGIPLWHGVVIGLFQSMALFPGLSRSGLTIASALFLGWQKEKAFKFSFLLAIPAIAFAGLTELKNIENWSKIFADFYWAGYLLAFITGLASLHLLKGIVLKKHLFYFSIYLFIISIIIIAAVKFQS